MLLYSPLNLIHHKFQLSKTSNLSDSCLLKFSSSDSCSKPINLKQYPLFYLRYHNPHNFILINSSERVTYANGIFPLKQAYLFRSDSIKALLNIISCRFYHSIHPQIILNSSESFETRTKRRNLKCLQNHRLKKSTFSRKNFTSRKILSNRHSSNLPRCLSFEDGKINRNKGDEIQLGFSDIDEYAFEEDEDYEEDLEENEIKCRIEHVSWHEVKVLASIKIFSTIETLWTVLSDYDHLAEFIPNLTRSERIKSPSDNCVWVLQEGMQQTLYWDISAQVVLELNETIHTDGTRRLAFSMIKGDFQKYFGKWVLIPFRRGSQTLLQYEVNVIPHFLLPSLFLEKVIKEDMPKCLQAIADRAEGNFSTLQQKSPENSFSFIEFSSSLLTGIVSNARSKLLVSGIPSNNSEYISAERNIEKSVKESLKAVNEVHLRRMDDLLERGGVHRRVISSITINAPAKIVWDVLTDYEKLAEFVPNLATSRVISRSENQVKLFQEGFKCIMYMAFHAKVLLQIYEKKYDEILFKQIQGDFESFRGKMVIETIEDNSTLLKYVVETKIRHGYLLAESLVEMIVYEDLPANLTAVKNRVEKILNEKDLVIQDSIPSPSPSILYPSFPAPESKTGENKSKIKNSINDKNNRIKKDYREIKNLQSPILSTSPPLLNQSKGENQYPLSPSPSTPSSIPSSSSLSSAKSASGGQKRRRKRVKGLQNDFGVLESEIINFIKSHGLDTGVMPTRPELREKKRVDLEKAISKMGGFADVAKRMGFRLSYSRKPKGYWENFENLKSEILDFQEEYGMDKKSMPSRRTFEKAGRYDISRALEKWGGLGEVAKLMGGLKIRREFKSNLEPKQQDSESNAKMDPSFRKVTNMSPKQSGDSQQLDPYPTESQSSLTEPKPMKASLPSTMKKWLKILTDMDV